MNTKSFVFVGDIVDQNNFDAYCIATKNTTNYAAFKYFNRLIKAIETRKYLRYTFLSVPFLGKYKIDTLLQNNDCFLDSDNWKYGKCSTKKYRRLFECNKTFKRLERKITHLKLDETSFIFVTQPNIFYLKSAFRIKQQHGNKPKIILFIPDLTEFSNLESHSFFVKFLKRAESKYVQSIIDNIDGFVLFSKHMIEKLKIRKKTVVIEAIADSSITKVEVKNHNHAVKTVLYSGTVNSQFGIKEFCESFSKIASKRKDVKLIIAGNGDLRSYLEKQDNKYIDYLGSLNTDKVIELQQSCDVVVNPRPNIGEYVKYSFPSKTIEYLLFNGNVACFKLDGIPNEYDSVLHYPKENTFDSLAELCVELAFSSCNERIENAKAISKLLINKTENAALNKLLCYLEELQ